VKSVGISDELNGDRYEPGVSRCTPRRAGKPARRAIQQTSG
jgi:hypothetical protein